MYALILICLNEPSALTGEQVMAALSSRAASFLADEDWKTIPWSGGGSVKNLMQHLLDIVVEVPAYLAKYDLFVDLLRRNAISADNAATRHRMLCKHISDLEDRLLFWKCDWADRYAPGQPKESAIHTSDNGCEPFPTFGCRDLETMAFIEPSPIVYPDALLAQSLCTYYATLLVLSASDLRRSEHGAVSEQRRYVWACFICRSVEFFVRSVRSPLVMRFMFVLRIAYDTFNEGTVERDFVKRVFVWISMRYKLKSFLGMVPEISVSRKTNITPIVEVEQLLLVP
jgi:hypothetical protein